MVLRPDQFTEQAQEILGTSQEIVRRYKHSQWDCEHILMALLEQKEGVPNELLQQLGVSVEALHDRGLRPAIVGEVQAAGPRARSRVALN